MTLQIISLIALFLGRPLDYMATIYDLGGIDAIAVVEYESQFNPRAFRREIDGTSYGLFQLYDKYHVQFRNDPLSHIITGVEFLEECKEKSRGSFSRAYSIYNSGTSWISIKKGEEVEALRLKIEKFLFLHLSKEV
jgi:hypothetical protein